MIEDCLLCREPLGLTDPPGMDVHTPEGLRRTHRECSLREVLGGIGHLIAHDLWCAQHHDPDAGLTYRQSAKLVDAYYRVVGMPQ